MSDFVVGLDLGQAQDFSAICVVELIEKERERREYYVRHLQRFKLGTPYPEIVAAVAGLMRMLKEESALVVDATGVGRPVVDLLVQAQLNPIAVTITGGSHVTSGSGSYRVPKRDLVMALTVALQRGRLKIAAGLPDAETLIEELLNFKVKINLKTAHDSYEAWREGQHDDLVLAVALAVWYAIRAIGLDDGPDSEMGNDERWMRGLPENTGDDMALISAGGGLETRNYL